MNGKDNLDEFVGKEPEQLRPKPLRTLKRVNSGSETTGIQNEYHGKYEADTSSTYKGLHEAEPSKPYHGMHEAEPSAEYHGKYEAESNVSHQRTYDADRAETVYRNEPPQRGGYENYYADKGGYDSEKKKKFSWKDGLVKTLSVVVSLALIFVLILNLPILWYKKDGQQERVSIVTYFKRWQPLVEIEGELDKTNVQPNINPDVVPNDYDDGLDLPQIVEGQYTVLFLGFEPDNFNTDVMWVCQFDLGAGKLRILQIPRDTAVPDFTTSASTKFNSIYSMGLPDDMSPVQRVVNAVQQNFGIPIDAYITTKCSDIEEIIDLIGGIPMNLDAPINFGVGQTIDAGDIVLNGQQSVWFVRYRAGWLEGDIGRMQNQRRFMAAAMQKLLDISKNDGKMKLYGYIKDIYDRKLIATDMSVEDMSKLSDFCGTLSMDGVQVDMVPGEGSSKQNPYFGVDGKEYSIYSIHKQETIDLLNEYYRPYQMPLTGDGDTAIVEYFIDHHYNNYDNRTETLDELLNGEAPARG
jgi:putative transcription regulator